MTVSTLAHMTFTVLAGAATIALILLGKWLQRRNAEIRGGWRYLTPGPLYWIAIFLCLITMGFLGYIYPSVANARFDAASQMKVLRILAVIFALIPMILAYMMMVDELRWNDRYVERRTLFFQRRRMAWHQLAFFGYIPILNYWWISGFQGPIIRFSPDYHGVRELLVKIRQNLPSNLPPGATEPLREAVAVQTSSPSSGHHVLR